MPDFCKIFERWDLRLDFGGKFLIPKVGQLDLIQTSDGAQVRFAT